MLPFLIFGYLVLGFATMLACARWSAVWRDQLDDDEGWLLFLGTIAVWPVVWWYALSTLVSIFRYARREGIDWRDVVESMRR